MKVRPEKFLFQKRELWALFFVFFNMSGCTKKETEKPTTPALLTQEQLVSKGKISYLNNCIACHHADPSKDGAIGPAIKGSSLELLEARIMMAKYPTGYTPKRNTGSMVALPHLKEDIPAIHAYLNSGN